MSKILKTAALVVGAVALVATGIGAAAGAGLIGAGIGSAATVAGVAASTLTTIGALAGAAAGLLSIGASLTAKKPTAQATGSPTDFSADPDAGIPLAIGRTGTAGDITARFGYDTKDKGDNDRQSFVATLSLGPIYAVEGMTVDKVGVSYSSVGAAIGTFAGFMWSMTQLGAMPEANALSFGAGAGSPPGWTAQHKMSGKAAATWTLRFDPNGKVYTNGVPAPMWTVRGAKCYDPTKDSTYPGGSGPHRMADPADTAAYDAASDTWEWTENPYLLGLRWAHGFWQRDRSNANAKYQRVMGMGATWSGIDVAAFVEGRNVALANGWKVGGMIYSGDDKWDTMKKILQAGMGEPLALGARISCLVNAPKVSLAYVTVDDVIGTASVAGTQPRRNRINTITPRYRLEANNWQLLPGAPIGVADYVTADRGKRSKVQDYPFIQQTPQVATAVRYDIENAREFGPITLPLKLVWMGYKPGDCVTVTLPEVGLNSQPVLLLNRELDPGSGIVTMTARSETAGKHPFALGQTSVPPPTPGLTGPPLIPVPGPNAWAITATSIQSASGTVPAIVVEGARDAATIDGIIFDYRKFETGLDDDAGWRGAGIEAPTTETKVITGVEAEVPYQVSVRYSRAGTRGDRLIIGPVGTDSFAVPWPAVTGPNRPEDNATYGAPGDSPVGDRTAFELLKDIQDNITSVSQLLGKNADLTRLINEVGFVKGQSAATYTEHLETNFNDSVSAINGFLDILASKSSDGTSAILNSNVTFSGPDGTGARSLQELSAQSDKSKLDVQFLRETVLGPDGTDEARGMFQVKDGDTIAGINLTAGGTLSVIKFLASIFQFTDPNGGDPITPFYYADKKLYLGDVIAQHLTVDGVASTFELTVTADGFSITIPGGLIFKGGKIRGSISQEAQFNIVFPEPFPTACVFGLPLAWIAAANNARDLYMQALGDPTQQGFMAFAQASTGNAQSLDGINWFAIGF